MIRLATKSEVEVWDYNPSEQEWQPIDIIKMDENFD
jgi:hypothetical protein